MKKILFILFALSCINILNAQNNNLYLNEQEGMFSYQTKEIPQQELKQMEAIIEQYCKLLNRYIQQVIENGDFAQTEEDIVSLFNTYGEQRDTRVYNDIPLIKTGDDLFFLKKSYFQNLQEYSSRLMDEKRYITDNIHHVLHSIENLIYVDNYKDLVIDDVPISMKYSVVRIPEGYYGDKFIPEHTLVNVSHFIYALDNNDVLKSNATRLVFSFRNGKIESIVPSEQTLAYNHAIRLYQSKNYQDSFRLLYCLSGCYGMFLSWSNKSVFYTLLAGCWRSGQIESSYPRSVQKSIASQYTQLVKYLPYLEAQINGNLQNISHWEDSVIKYIVGLNLFEQPEPFSEGLLPVWDSITQRVGYIDVMGNFVIEPKFLTAFRFYNGLASALDPSTGKYGLINKNGFYVIKPEYLALLKTEKTKKTYGASRDLKKYGCLNLHGEVCVPLIYEDPVDFYFDEQYAPCRRGGKYGVVRIDGKEVVPCQYNDPIISVVKKDDTLYYNAGQKTYSIKLQ